MAGLLLWQRRKADSVWKLSKFACAKYCRADRLWQVPSALYLGVVQHCSKSPLKLFVWLKVKINGVTDHYEASIRTPVTPKRWKDFDAELTAVWEAVIDALASADKPKIAVAVLTFVYYWYNFMPLARGTAVCGHITLLSLFALAGMPLTAAIPVVRLALKL